MAKLSRGCWKTLFRDSANGTNRGEGSVADRPLRLSEVATCPYALVRAFWKRKFVSSCTIKRYVLWRITRDLFTTRYKEEEESMSSVKQFELFHGLVLAKIQREKRPTTLSMIKTSTQEEWSTYEVSIDGAEIYNTPLFFKHSSKSKPLKKTGAESWTFNFTSGQLKQLREKKHRIVLICGFQNIKSAKDMQICFPAPEQVEALLDLSSPDNVTRTVRVQAEKNKKLRVFSNRTNDTFTVGRKDFSIWVDGK